MFTRDTKIVVIGQDGFGRPTTAGSIADKALEAARLGETYEPEIVCYDVVSDTMSVSKAIFKAADKQANVVTLTNHINTDALTCGRNVEVYLMEKGWVKASDVTVGDRSRMPAVRFDKKDTVVASKFLTFKYPTVLMDVVEVTVKGDVKAFFAGSALVRIPQE